MRFLIIKYHYRSPIDYNEKLISQTENELQRIDEFLEKIKNTKPKTRINSKFEISKFQKEFDAAMEDDFNTPKAMAVIFDLVNKGNILVAKEQLSVINSKIILEFLRKIDNIFNFIFWKKLKPIIPAEIKKLVKEREKYRKQKNWRKSDEIRQKIKELGWLVEDTGKGPII